MLSKKEFKIILFCIGLVCIGFMYDVACDSIMDMIEDREKTSELEHSNHTMETIEV